MAMNPFKRLIGRLHLVVAALVAVTIAGIVTVLANRPSFKLLWDASPQAQFSVTADTETLLREVRAQGKRVEIDTFFVPLPRPSNASERHLIGIQQRIQSLTVDILRRYADLGGEAVAVRHHDLMRDVAETRTRIEELGGIREQNTLVVSLGKRKKELHLSLDLADIHFPQLDAVRAPGARQSLPTLRSYKGEEAISSAIRSLLVHGTPRAYLIQNYRSAELRAAVADSYSELLTELEKDGFAIDFLDLEKQGRIPDDAAVVALLEPRRDEMSDAAADAILDYLRRGGRFVLNVSFSPTGSGWNPVFDRLGHLLDFELGKGLVCHLVPDAGNPQSPGVAGPRAQNITVEQMPPQHPITRSLVAARRYPVMKLAREVRARGSRIDGITCDPSLMRTGRWAWVAAQHPGTLEIDFSAPPNAEAYASRSVGAIVDVAPAIEGGRPGHAVVLGGMSFLNMAFATNGDLALNLFNWMAERTELVTVRGNRYRSEKIELSPQQVERIGRLLQLWTPGVLLAAGLVVFFVRSRR